VSLASYFPIDSTIHHKQQQQQRKLQATSDKQNLKKDNESRKGKRMKRGKDEKGK